MQFDLPSNTVKWGYYFRSIEKHRINEALSRNYFKDSDFIPDSLPEKSNGNKKFYIIGSRVVGPVKLEVLLLDKAGIDDFLLAENDICVIQRPDEYFKNESSLCEVGDCHSSNKVIVDSQLNGEYYLGFRNINFRENAYIIVQIVALVK